jgi:KTSC domain
MAKPPALTPVKSSAMKAYAYEPHTGTLTVEFHSGKRWAYEGVSLERATAFEGAASKGRYFSDQIKPHHAGREVK